MFNLRPLGADDLPQIKNLIKAAWFKNAADDPAVLDALTFIYLNPAMHDSSFAQVAVAEDKVVGVIFCSQRDQEAIFRRLQSDGMQESLSLLRAGAQDFKWVMHYLTEWEEVYARLLEHAGTDYQAKIELLCVHPDWRRRHVATALLTAALDYCADLRAPVVCALTDTPEQLVFFTHAGFIRIAQDQINVQQPDAVGTAVPYSATVHLCAKTVSPADQIAADENSVSAGPTR